MDIRKHIILVFIFLLSFQITAQNKWILTAGGALGFNNSTTYLWKYEVKNTTTSGVFFQAGYSYNFYKKFSFAVEPGIQQYYDVVKIDDTKVSVFAYSLKLPMSISYKLHKKWQVFFGYSFQNYRELEDMELLKSNNIRENLFLGTRYHFKRHWAIYFSYSRMVSKQVDYLTAKQFENQLYFGVSFCFGKQLKKGVAK